MDLNYEEAVAALYEKSNPKLPVFSLQPGSYDTWQMLEISGNFADEIIYYTLDGSEPGEDSEIYREFLILPGGVTTVKARALNSRGFESEVAVAEYAVLRERQEITFEDAYMERCTRNILGKWNGTLYDEDAATIRTLTLVGPYDQDDSNAFLFTEKGYERNQYTYTDSGHLMSLADLCYMPFLQELRIAYQDKLSLDGIEELHYIKSLPLIHDGVI